MRFLMIAPQPFFQPRGTPFSVLHRLRALSELGHQVDLMTYPLGEDRAIPGVRILRSARVPGIRSVKVGPSIKKIPLDLMLAARVLPQVRRERYDVIHTHEEACFLGALLSGRSGRAHLYDMHSSLPQQLENYGFLAYRPVLGIGRALERFVLRRSRGVIAICEALRDLALTQGADPERLFLIHNRPVDESPVPTPGELTAFRQRIQTELGCQLDGRRIVLYTGTFEKNQGLELMLEAFAPIAARHTDALLALVGGTPDQVQNLQDAARQAGLADRTLIAGRRPVEEMALWMEASSVLCSPRTRGTNTPLKIYSYLRAGKPILATDLETHRQVLDQTTALLVPPTSAALAEGLERLLSDGQLGQRLAAEAQRVAEDRYSAERYLGRHRQMLQKLFGASA